MRIRLDRLTWGLLTIVAGASLVAGACSGAPAASSGTETALASSSAPAEVATVPPVPPAESSSLATDPPASESTQLIDPATDVCAPFEGGAQPPATAEETALLDRMPKTVDGEPIDGPEAYQAMQVFCPSAGDGNALVEVIAEMYRIDLRTVVMGRFGVTVDDATTRVEVYRAPGQDANAMLSAFAELGLIDPASPTLASVGGKDVMYIDDSYGFRNYRYVDGDTVWAFSFPAEWPSQAATLIQALG